LRDLVSCDPVMQPFAREILARLAGTGDPVPLILDQSKVPERHQVLMLSVRWGERALLDGTARRPPASLFKADDMPHSAGVGSFTLALPATIDWPCFTLGFRRCCMCTATASFG